MINFHIFSTLKGFYRTYAIQQFDICIYAYFQNPKCYTFVTSFSTLNLVQKVSIAHMSYSSLLTVYYAYFQNTSSNFKVLMHK